jgi:serine/threonine protein kinase
MKFKITCPYCANSLTLSDPKPGKYKPKCSKCGSLFAVIVESGDDSGQVKIRVGKMAPATPAQPTTTVNVDTPANSDLLQVVTPVDTASPQTSQATAKTNTRDHAQPVIEPQAALSTEFSATLPPEQITAVSSDAMLSPQAAGPFKSPEIEATQDPSLVDAPQLSAFAATMDEAVAANTQNNKLDVTIETSSVTLGSSASSNLPDPKSSMQAKNSGSASPASPTIPTGNDFSINNSNADAIQDGSDGKSVATVERLGGYKIVKQIGEGGMGKVYLARQISLDRPCAVKTIQAGWAKNPKAVARFIREAYAAAQLTHHNVVQIYDLGQEAGIKFFSMELVSGGSLDDQLRTKGKLTAKLAATLILQAARGLKFAHDHGMVHRDIKPANLMLTNDGLVKIADMGLVKTPHSDESAADASDMQAMMLSSAKTQVTLAGASLGTPAYMAPEQAADATTVDKRADIYSLGCTFFALLTGRPPFDGKTLLEVITKHRNEKIARPDVVVAGLPTKLGDIIERMTEKQPSERYQDLEEVIEDLEVFLELREDLSAAKIRYFDARDYRSADANKSPERQIPESADAQQAKPAESPKSIAPLELPAELAGKIQLAAKTYHSSPILIARRAAPLAWLALCGGLCILNLAMALWSGIGLLTEGAMSLAATATQAVGNATGAVAPTDKLQSPAASASSAASHFSNLVWRAKFALGSGLSLLLAPIGAIFLAGREGRSPLARRYRESFLAGGLANFVFAGFAGLVSLLLANFLGLWVPLIVGATLGLAAGAGYYFGLEKPLEAQRKKPLSEAQGLLKQLRLRGMDEEQVQLAFAKHSGKDWEELFEDLFDYDSMRLMRSKLAQTNTAPRRVFAAYRDKLIDRLSDGLANVKRAKEEKLLAATEKAELVAAGMSTADAQKQAEAVAACMVDAASETKKAMSELAVGRLTDQAAEDKRQRIKQMLAEARSGKFSKKDRRSRAVEAMLGQLLGGKLRFALAAVLLLATGLWGSANQQAMDDYWQQAKSAVSNISLEAGLEKVAESAKSTLEQSAQHRWVPVIGGLVDQKNVLFVGLAGLLLAWGAFWQGWKVSLAFIPAALLLVIIPWFF